jgi:hypothetical protein
VTLTGSIEALSINAARSSPESTNIRSNWASVRMRLRACQRQEFHSASVAPA